MQYAVAAAVLSFGSDTYDFVSRPHRDFDSALPEVRLVRPSPCVCYPLKYNGGCCVTCCCFPMQKMYVFDKRTNVKIGEVVETTRGCCDYPLWHAYTTPLGEKESQDIFQILPTTQTVLPEINICAESILNT